MAPPDGERRYFGSDLVVDVLKSKRIPFLALNPGASFRGLHDSIVNHGGNDPEIILVPHEKVAVGIAHGYAKATGTMMGVVLHDLVGLLHGTMGVYYAYVDRVPMLILGGAGPMDAARRRPWIDWVHTANVQNTSVRDFTKWDDHPYSVEAIPDSLERGHRIAGTEPRGPVYIALDADLQEQAIEEGRLRPVAGDAAPTRLAADPDAIESIAEALCAARRPAIVAGSVGRDRAMWPVLIELAELLGAGVVDTNLRHNFPNRHPLNVTGSNELESADAVLLLDIKDIGQHTHLMSKEDRGDKPHIADGAKVLDIGFGDLGISAWSADHGSLYSVDVRVVADTSLALPALLHECRRRIDADEPARAGRRAELAAVHDSLHVRWRAVAERHVEDEPMSTATLVLEVGKALEGHDWVLTAGTGNGWATRLWDFDKHDRHAGRSLGTATQIGISLGVALAYRGSGRLVVDLQPDGDLMFDPGALWVATHHRIPMLVVMVNNRAYNNDWIHQRTMASERGNPVENARVGITIEDPDPDFAGLARSFGWHAQGPVTRPEDIAGAVAEAISVISTTGQPALVDIVCSAER
ncbi:thiamine pyrophosphate-binding protein [Jiangella ureilytica]|uniref:Thiamine pyrophosphate-binding protein n=1 Tax=Jiangella ureilytica TaxID=2530374 RepID=A0A4R4REF6_9ACTN|nr:thiamine pyrophosphate-binding protein [Jiangella ureilytica]TDC47546.1 thiamine pyrophosphate-binding protein [Jiangella ureilytica]